MRESKVCAAVVCLLLALTGISACGGDGGSGGAARVAPPASDFPNPEGKAIESFLGSFAPSDLVVQPAATVFVKGKNRYPIGVFEVDGAQVDNADVALYFAKSVRSDVKGPYPARVDSLETKPAFRSQGADAVGEASSVYVADPVNFDRPGPWLAMAVIRTDEGFEATRLPSPTVDQFPHVAKVGQQAPRISTVTANEVGDLGEIDTRQPPSTMHDVDFADVVGKKPVALVIATPALCKSRVCGPVVDVAEQVKAEVGDKVSFIHQEVFEDNDPNKGVRSQLKAFGLQTEPWIFLIDQDGVIQQRIEGAIGVEELRDAVESLN